tara:strand:+ start:1306 stop:1482 length:177 start_codon:yes stop_codon:yes gene_type:complete
MGQSLQHGLCGGGPVAFNQTRESEVDVMLNEQGEDPPLGMALLPAPLFEGGVLGGGEL